MATPEQAEIIVNKHFHDEKNLNAPYGIRTLSPQEKMYYVGASGNPSSWLGPIWIVSNYMTFSGLLNYGYEEEAREIAVKTVLLLGKDLSKSGGLHEYYLPNSGEPVLNKGFLNWNLLVANMIAWLEKDALIKEF
jgi:putative isomerase